MVNNRDLQNNRIATLIRKIPIIVSTMAILFLLYDIGFISKSDITYVYPNIYFFTVLIGAISIIGRYLYQKTRPRLIILSFDIILFSFSLIFVFQYLELYFLKSTSLFKHPYWLYLAIILVFLRELSAIKINSKKAIFNPAQLFIISFFSIIVIGVVLLMLPNATLSQITLIDAMFTSTSAVCVTGLIVVDTGSFFTQFGQIIILLLIQAGGIGIMTFTSYFSYFFKGVSSYENQLILSQVTNTEKIAEVFTTLRRIIMITFLIEGIGAFLIFHSIDSTVIPFFNQRVFSLYFILYLVFAMLVFQHYRTVSMKAPINLTTLCI